jgi:hypothetical protein
MGRSSRPKSIFGLLIYRVRRLLPYLIAGGALTWVLWRTDLAQLRHALSHAPMGWFIALSALMLLINCAADTFAMGQVFAWFGCRIPFRDLFVVRGSTYLLAVINYHVGQAAILGYLYRARKVPLLRAGGWILFIIGVNVGTLFLLASAGASQARGDLAWLRLVPLLCGAGVLIYAAILWWKPAPRARHRLLGALFEMGISGHAKGVLVRLPHVGVLLVWHFLALRMFGIAVSPLQALLYLPAYFAVAALPINVNGLGVAQVVAITFFAPYAVVDGSAANPAAAREAAVIAYSLATSGISIVLQLLLGLACLPKATAIGLDTEAAEEAAAAARAAEEAEAAGVAVAPAVEATSAK